MLLEQIENVNVSNVKRLRNKSGLFHRFISDTPTQEFGNRLHVRVHCSGRLLFGHDLSRVTVFPAQCQTRAPIRQFTERSGRRMRKYLRECVPVYTGMVTLTYPEGHGFTGATAKRDIRAFFKRVERRYPRDIDTSHFWFMEFQARGAIHFHILTTQWMSRRWVADSWYEIVGSEDSRHAISGTRVESLRAGRGGTISYASKYAAKMTQKHVPEDFGWVGRFWGVVGARGRMVADTTIGFNESINPEIDHLLRVLDEYVFSCLKNGDIVASKYSRERSTMLICGCDFVAMRVRLMIERIENCRRDNLEGLSEWGYMPELEEYDADCM